MEVNSKSVRDTHRYSMAKATEPSQTTEASISDASATATVTKSASTGGDRRFNSDEDGFFYNEAGVKLEVKEVSVSYDTKQWLKHAEKAKDGPNPLWCCIWETKDNGGRTICGYSSKTHLVKRHIENTHL